MIIPFDKVFVTQNYLTINSVFWYLANHNRIPIAVRQIPETDSYLILDGHNQLAGDFLRNRESDYKIIGHINELLMDDLLMEMKSDEVKAIRQRNTVIQDRFEIILDHGHQYKKRSIVDIMNYRTTKNDCSFLDTLFIFQKDYIEAGQDLFKMNNVREDLEKYKI